MRLYNLVTAHAFFSKIGQLLRESNNNWRIFKIRKRWFNKQSVKWTCLWISVFEYCIAYKHLTSETFSKFFSSAWNLHFSHAYCFLIAHGTTISMENQDHKIQKYRKKLEAILQLWVLLYQAFQYYWPTSHHILQCTKLLLGQGFPNEHIKPIFTS